MQETAGWYRRSPVSIIEIACARLVFSPFLFTPSLFSISLSSSIVLPACPFFRSFRDFQFYDRLTDASPLRLFERKAARVSFHWTRFQSSINYDNSNYQIQYTGILQNYTDIYFSSSVLILSLCFSHGIACIRSLSSSKFFFSKFLSRLPFITILSLSQLVLQFLLSSFLIFPRSTL